MFIVFLILILLVVLGDDGWISANGLHVLKKDDSLEVLKHISSSMGSFDQNLFCKGMLIAYVEEFLSFKSQKDDRLLGVRIIIISILIGFI